MVRLKNNLVVKGFSGKLGDDLIFKNYHSGTVISKYPDMSKVKRTKSQKKFNSLFAQAVQHARIVANDPSLKEYEKKAKKTGRTIYHLALSDYMKEIAKP